MKMLLGLFMAVGMCNGSYYKNQSIQKDGIALAWSGMGAYFVVRENPDKPNEITVSSPALAQQLAAIKEELIIRAIRKERLKRERQQEQRVWFLHAFHEDFVAPSLYGVGDNAVQHHTFFSDFDKSCDSDRAFAWRLFEESLKNCEPMSKKRGELERLAVLRRLSNRDKRLAEQHADAKRCALHVKKITSRAVKGRAHPG